MPGKFHMPLDAETVAQSWCLRWQIVNPPPNTSWIGLLATTRQRTAHDAGFQDWPAIPVETYVFSDGSGTLSWFKGGRAGNPEAFRLCVDCPTRFQLPE